MVCGDSRNCETKSQMAIAKPYKRIWRPLKEYNANDIMTSFNRKSLDYLRDERYACQAEMRLLVSTARLMLHDLYELFYFIEPNDINLQTYSHRVYELYLRAATEFESNCKRILEDNGYCKPGNWTITDYAKLSSVARLSEYRVMFLRWTTAREFKPFAGWSAPGTPLSWYQDYNGVKHNRYEQFTKANLGNLMNAIAGVLCVLHAQWGEKMTIGFIQGLHCAPDSQEVLDLNDVTIYAPHFTEAEQYDFVWDDIQANTDAVQTYQF